MLVVDTSSWIAFFRGETTSLLDAALRDGRVLLPPMVAAELTSAARLTPRQRTDLRDFVTSLQLCETPLAHWIAVGELRALLARKGIAVSTPDAHVAQCARDAQAELMTDDAIFSRIAVPANLRVIPTR